MALCTARHERRGRIDRDDRRGTETFDELRGERARAASDIEGAVSVSKSSGVHEVGGKRL
jgi:hypothetical protein